MNAVRRPVGPRSERAAIALFFAVLYLGGAFLVAGGLDWIPLADRSIPSRVAAIAFGTLMMCLGAWFSYAFLVESPRAARAKDDRELSEDLRLGPFWECPSCKAKRMVLIEPYSRYFCLECRRYASKDYRPPASMLGG